MDIKDLVKFIEEAHKGGYAAGEGAGKVKEKDGSTTIIYQKSSWKYHDNYFGGEPYGGREIIFYNNEPVWIMVYYGRVEKSVEDFEGVYKFLQKALKLAPEEAPFRGPDSLEESKLAYKNSWQGGIEDFSGEEVIYQDKKEIYRAKYIGGLVDVRKE